MLHTFKVGDAVKLINVKPGWCAEVGDTGKIITLYDRRFNGEPAYIVELDKSPGSRIPYSSRRLELLDDPLPPVPDSVRYYNSFVLGQNDQHLTLHKDNPVYPGSNLLGLTITPYSASTRSVERLAINLDPDAALQLAHDLRRMAMEIKRKQKRGDTI